MYLREQKSLYCMCKWMQILENTTVAMHNTVMTKTQMVSNLSEILQAVLITNCPAVQILR